jgi:flagellar hook-length control protein FliK
VPLAHAPEAVHDLIALARSRDATHARLVLHPADLGGVEVRLRHDGQGLHASVHVEHPEALAALDRGLGDLRRALESRGVTVATLDLSLAGGRQDGSGGWAASGDGGFGRPAPHARRGTPGPDGLDPDPLSTPSATAARPSAGAIVDVMA